MPFSAQHILAMHFGGIARGGMVRGVDALWEREKGKNKKQTNKIKIRSFYTFYGDCYSLSAH